MSQIASVIVVGASAAGISCIRHLRHSDFTGSICLVDKDEHGAYERPPLSKQILMDPETSAVDIALISKDELSELNVTTYFGEAVTALDPQTKTITLASNKTLSADAIVLATGGEANRLPIQGAHLPQVKVLRHFNDAVELRKSIRPKTRVAVIGGGFIGAETSASLAQIGAQVYWLDAAKLPLSHLLPAPLCQKIVDHHCAHGVTLTSNCRIRKFTVDRDTSDNSELENSDFENSHFENSELNNSSPDQKDRITIGFTDGSTLSVDTIVMGVGMSPNTAYLSDEIRETLVHQDIGGIRVDERQATEYPGVYAAGDVAAITQADGVSVRHEHWQSAQFQGERVAAAILNNPLPDEPIHWFWSDQGDLHIEMAGQILPNNQYLVERLEGSWPVYFSVVDNKVIGAVSVNNPNAVRASLRMIKNNVTVDDKKLCDPSIPLRKLMRG